MRLARANGLKSAYAFLPALGIDTAGLPGESVIMALAAATGQPPERLWGMQTPRDPLTGLGVRGALEPPSLFGVVFTHVCVACLRDDERPYLRREWVRRSRTACQVHGIDLLLHCPACAAPLVPERPPQPGGRFRRAAVSPTWDYRACWHCGQALTASGQGQDIPHRPQRVLRSGSLRPSQDEWAGFSFAVWSVWNRFELASVLPGTRLRVDRIDRVMTTVDTFEKRKAAHDAVEWILYGGEDRFDGALSRFQASAAALLGLLVEVAELSTPFRAVLAWILTWAVDEMPSGLTREWPRVALGLIDMLDAGEGAALAEPVRLDDREWALIERLLRDLPLSLGRDQRMMFDALLNRAVQRMALYDDVPFFRDRQVWFYSGRFGLALEVLYRDASARERLGCWRTVGVIELARHAHRGLHRELVLAMLATRSATAMAK